MRPDLRLVAPAVALWIAAALTIAVPDAARPLAVITWLLAAVALVAARLLSRRSRDQPHRRADPRRRRRRRGPVLSAVLCCVSLAAVALVSTVIGAQLPARAPVAVMRAAADGDQVTVTVRTQSTPSRLAPAFDGEPRWRWRGTTETIAIGEQPGASPERADAPAGTTASVPVTVIATLPARESREPASSTRSPDPTVPGPAIAETASRPPAFGSVLLVTGTISANDPGEPTAFTIRATEPVQRVADPPWWLGWTEQVRERFAAAAAVTPGDGGTLLPGLAIGDDTAVGAELDASMKASSLSHLTAVSGANCALVTAAVFFLSACAGLGRRGRVVAALLALLAFVVLVTPGASVVRAATMAVVVLIGIARGRPSQGVPVLALAVMVLLVHDPWLARDYGFALSVLATGGLIVLGAPLTRILSRWMPRAVALGLAVPIAAQLACQPVLVMLAPTIPLYGVVANVLAAPAAPVATLLGCLACVALPLLPAIGQALVWIAWLPSAWIAQVATTTSALPASALPWADGVAGVLLCAAVLAAVAVLVLGRRRIGRGVQATLAACFLALGTVGYLGMLGGGLVGRSIAVPGDWQLAACDVGQGDALLVRDAGEIAMIDVGRRPAPVAACLDRLGIARLQLLVLTHFDLDHVGGLDAVLGKVERAIVGEPGRAIDHRAVESLRAAGVRVEQGVAGDEGAIGGLRWRILWPPGAQNGEPVLGGNPGSVTLAIEGSRMRSVFLGDLGEDSQDRLLAGGGVQPVDVVKVAHHGSADQSEPLYAALRASLALVSVGDDNGYGHPTASALGMLARGGTTVARTDTSGLILVSPGAQPGRLEVWTERRRGGAGRGPADR